ncbi:hypothetical protein AB6A40_010282 [Gnathostoma spinigerum]|uniref:Uncharacterized protein n=1 Tax=Gnathostoma spinigerum TaxID=75299 RepID=A0ABD6EUE4_9BILA
MPNITFNGLSQRDPANCDDEYEFGILPDDDDMGNIPTGEEIDAVNDETFGEDINFQDADDLEEFAKQMS